MNIFIIVFAAIMIISEILSVVLQLQATKRNHQLTPQEEKICYIKNNRNIFGIFEAVFKSKDKEIIVLSPEEIGM